MDLSTLLAALAGSSSAGVIPYITAAIAAAAALDAGLPQPAPGSHWLPLRKAISFVAVNFWNASNGAQPQLSTWLARVLQPLLPALQAAAAAPLIAAKTDVAVQPAPAQPGIATMSMLVGMLAMAGALAGCTSAEVDTAATDVDKGVAAACADYLAAKPVGAAIGALAPAAAPIVVSLEQYGDSVCATPAPTTDAGTAAWVGQITGQVLALSAPPATAAP
jgi:hypothetical protein